MSIPSARDQYQSRLQLMLYKRLLAPLMDASSFMDIISQLGIDTSAPFSPAFIQSQEYLSINNGLGQSVQNSMCVGDLMMAWIEALQLLELAPSSIVEDQLELIYRLRKGTINRNLSFQRRKSEGVSKESRMTAEAEAEPRERSLEVNVAAGPPSMGTEGIVPPLVPSPLTPSSLDEDAEDAAILWALQESLSSGMQNAAVFGARAWFDNSVCAYLH